MGRGVVLSVELLLGTANELVSARRSRTCAEGNAALEQRIGPILKQCAASKTCECRYPMLRLQVEGDDAQLSAIVDAWSRCWWGKSGDCYIIRVCTKIWLYNFENQEFGVTLWTLDSGVWTLESGNPQKLLQRNKPDGLKDGFFLCLEDS